MFGKINFDIEEFLKELFPILVSFDNEASIYSIVLFELKAESLISVVNSGKTNLVCSLPKSDNPVILVPSHVNHVAGDGVGGAYKVIEFNEIELLVIEISVNDVVLNLYNPTSNFNEILIESFE